MIPTIIIIALIAVWAAFVIIRKVKRAKRGIYCECCHGECGCAKKKKAGK